MNTQSCHQKLIDRETRGLPPGIPLVGLQGEDDVFVGVHTHNLPPGSPMERQGSNRLRMVDLLQRRWAYDGCFYVAFLPVELETDGPLSPLSFTWNRIPVREVSLHPPAQSPSSAPIIRYQLEPCMQNFLRRQLFRATQCISILSNHHFAHDGVLYPLDIFLPAARDDLSKTFCTPRSVRQMAMTFRSKVLACLALLSYTVAMQTDSRETVGTTAREARRQYMESCFARRGTLDIESDETLKGIRDTARLPRWYMMLESHEAFIHSDWVTSMWATWVFDLDRPRLGALVDITLAIDNSTPDAGTSWFTCLPHVMKVMPHTPWWLHYPHGASTRGGKQSPLADYYSPSSRDVQRLLENRHKTPPNEARAPYSPVLSVSHLPTPADYITASNPADAVGPLWGSSHDSMDDEVGWKSPEQLPPSRALHKPPPLERSWPMYLNKTLEWSRICLLEETDSEQQSRLEREAAAREAFPWSTDLGKKNYRAKFVEWSQNPDASWNYTTHSSKPTEAEKLWHKTAAGQRVYDSLQNIWHVSDEFVREQGAWTHDEIAELERGRENGDDDPYEDESAWPRRPEEGYNNVAHPLPTIQDPFATGAPSSAPASHARSFGMDDIPGQDAREEERYPILSSDIIFWDARRELPVAMKLEDAWQGWWGLQLTPLSANLAATEQPALTRREVLRMVSYEPAHDGQLSEGQWELLARLFKTFTRKKGESREAPVDETIPAAWCDFVRGSLYSHPCKNTASSVKLRRVDTVDQRVGYMVSPADGSPADSHSWSLVVTDPLCALHIVRNQWGPKSDHIVRQLVARGISFHMIRPHQPGVLHYDTTTERLGLGRLVVGSRPGLIAYSEYIARRHQLVHGPVGRAGLCAGGILWRLVMDTQGAGEESLWFADWHRPTFRVDVGEEVWADDELSPQERDLIVGVYRVLNGTGNINNAASKSWWPRHEEWIRSAQYAGYWTAHNEMWFRGRRQDILDGKEGPKSIKEWQLALKGDRQWPDVRNRMEKVAGEALTLQLEQRSHSPLI